MGVLGKDLFDFDRPHTHVKVQFGRDAYWVESEPTPHPYGEVLTELLNYDLAPYEHTLSVLEQVIEAKDTQAAPRAFMDAVRDLFALPYFRLFLSDLHKLNAGPVAGFVVGEARTAFEEYIFSEGKQDIAYMEEQSSAIRFVQERYTWFLAEIFYRTVFEKKKGQRKVPLEQQICENGMDAFVSGVSLGKSPKVDAPQVNIQYAVLEIDEEHHELVEKLYFDRLGDFVYVELMRGIRGALSPSGAPTADGGFCRRRAPATTTATGPRPTVRRARPAGRWDPPRAFGPRCKIMASGPSTSEPIKNTLPERKREP